MKIEEKYFVKVSEIKHEEPYWSYYNVDIYMRKEDGTEEKIGNYERNYHGFAERTFFPFRQGDKEYALYSKSYTATRVMELPSCEDLCGEEPKSHGFCPVEFYVPSDYDYDNYKTYEDYLKDWEDSKPTLDGQFGFVAGCIWGDDTSWKIEFLDLSKISEGIFKREDRFGYIELPGNLRLKEAINVRWLIDSIEDFEDCDSRNPFIRIAVDHMFDLITGEELGCNYFNREAKFKVGDYVCMPGAYYPYFRTPSKIIKIDDDNEFAWLENDDIDHPVKLSHLYLAKEEDMFMPWKEYNDYCMRGIRNLKEAREWKKRGFDAGVAGKRRKGIMDKLFGGKDITEKVLEELDKELDSESNNSEVEK